jgi:hypothetical protein
MHFSKGVVFLETRIIPDLFEIIQDGHLKYVPEDWKLTLFLSKENRHLIDREKFKRNVEIIILPYDNFSVGDYNNLLTSTSFWSVLDSDKLLIIQSDSRLLRTGVTEFLEYDFIGAPLYHIDFPAMNGGLSLRDKKAMLEVLNKHPYRGEWIDGNEDIYFCNSLKKMNGKLPSKERAQLFSVETIENMGSLGTHALDKWHSKEVCEKILNQYL